MIRRYRLDSTRAAGNRPAPSSLFGFAVCCAVALAGCTNEKAYFSANLVEIQARQSEDEPVSEDQKQQMANMLLALFGTPDAPNAFAGDKQLQDEKQTPLERFGFDVDKLKLAAGPSYIDKEHTQHGLYRRHCAHCHGVTGDGKGPTAPFLNPYPRDYRQGKFKFKSTFGPAKPTHDDLKHTLIEGIPGTAMPSFKLLPDNELEALVEYVKYLSARGQTEIKLIEALVFDGELPAIADVAGGFPLPLDDEGYPDPAELPPPENVVASVVYEWDVAPTKVIYPVTPSLDFDDREVLAASIDRGRKLFYSAQLKCSNCHGDAALGDGETTNYSDWMKEIYDPDAQKDMYIDPAREATMLALGAMKPRTIRPRNLRLGVFRGGRRPIDIYRRIFSGINGSPMPAQGHENGIAGDAVADADAGGALPREQIWDVVNYVLSLQYEPLSRGDSTIEGFPYTLR